MGMNQEGHFGVQFAECRVRGERHLHHISYAAHIYKHLIRSFLSKPPAQLPNHRFKVLTSARRLSTQCVSNYEITQRTGEDFGRGRCRQERKPEGGYLKECS